MADGVSGLLVGPEGTEVRASQGLARKRLAAAVSRLALELASDHKFLRISDLCKEPAISSNQI
jgi:hypothetical protein